MSKEIYARAPVQFVSFVARFPLSPALQAPGGKEAVYGQLRESFPLLEEIHFSRVELSVGPGEEPRQAVSSSTPHQLRMTSRERTHSFTLGPRMALFQCTDHESYERFEQVLRPVLEAVAEHGEPTGLLKAELRYVDEIRHPSVSEPQDWRSLVHDSVVGPVDLLDGGARETAGLAVYPLSDRHELRLGYGAVKEGFVIDPQGPLRVRGQGSGPCFRLDLESTWTAPNEAVPTFDVEGVLDIAGELHTPIHDAFEAIIKPDLREHFRGDDDDAA